MDIQNVSYIRLVVQPAAKCKRAFTRRTLTLFTLARTRDLSRRRQNMKDCSVTDYNGLLLYCRHATLCLQALVRDASQRQHEPLRASKGAHDCIQVQRGSAPVRSVWLSLSICLWWADVSKRLDGSSWLLAWRLPSTYPTASEMTYTASGGALNSTQTKPTLC